MTPELTVLTLVGLLHAVQYVLVSIPANMELGSKITLAPRDDGPLSQKVSPKVARLARALDNNLAAMAFFAVAVMVVTLGDQSSPRTALLAWIFLSARILYIPAYYFGWTPWRSVFWGVGYLATVIILLAALI